MGAGRQGLTGHPRVSVAVQALRSSASPYASLSPWTEVVHDIVRRMRAHESRMRWRYRLGRRKTEDIELVGKYHQATAVPDIRTPAK